MIQLPKYPRTLHLAGSKGITDPDAVPFSEITKKYLVIEEKMDGSMVGIAFDENADIHIFHRNQEVRGSEFDLLKQFLNTNLDTLFDRLEDRYIMYGEWMFACHTIFYDALPSYFLEYDIYDCLEGKWLSTKRRQDLLYGLPIISVTILEQAEYCHIDEILDLIRSSNFISFDNKDNAVAEFEKQGLRRGDALATLELSGYSEGLYIKYENDQEVLGRFKYIRKDFLDKILQSEHWSKRSIIQNKLTNV